MKYTTIFILLLILLTSCSTTKDTTTKYREATTDVSLNQISDKYFAIGDNILLKASLSINFPSQNNSASSTIEIAGTDSILIKISAFLGISVGQLYANKNEFIMNNNFESTTYVGVPTEENIMSIAFIPLSFNDLICILKCIPPQNITAYKYKNDANIFEFTDENKIEHIFLDSFSAISKIVRTDIVGNEIFVVEYSDYAIFNEKKIAKKMVIKFPQQVGRIEINYSDVQFKDKPTSPMKIFKPKSYKLKELN